MIKFTRKYSLVLVLLVAVIFGACQKQTLNKLEGTWTLIPIQKPTEDIVEEWTFKEGDFQINRTEIFPDTTITTLYEEGTYTLNATFTETTLDLQPTRDATFIRHYTGEWQVYEIKQDHMTLLHFIEDDHGMSMREFERNN